MTSSSDANVFVSFQLVDDNTYLSQKETLEKTIFEIFGKTYKLEHEDPHSSQQELEVIYKIQKPLRLEDEALRSFFENLKLLFEKAARNLPSFTQVLEPTE